MNEDHWAAIILGVVIITVLGAIAVVIKSGWADWFIR